MLGCLAQALLSELAAAEEAQAAGEAEARTLRSRLSVAALAAAAEGEAARADPEHLCEFRGVGVSCAVRRAQREVHV